MDEVGLDALWKVLSADLPPETELMLRRLIKAHVQFLVEVLKAAERSG